jgi:hypothetical protein
VWLVDTCTAATDQYCIEFGDVVRKFSVVSSKNTELTFSRRGKR